jgi:hypothetical protein
MVDIDDHKRQSTFGNVDLQQNMNEKKILLNEQLELLQIVDRIYSVFIKLEMNGHTEYQLRDQNYEIRERTGKTVDK